MKRPISLALAIVLCMGLCACGKSKEAIAVDEMILAIGEVTIDSISAIEEADTAYNALSDKERESVENYEVLAKAKEDLFYIELYDLTNKHLEVYYDCQNVSNGTRIIWKNVGSSDFWSSYNAVRAISLGLTREEYDKITMEMNGTKAFALFWGAARGLCPSNIYDKNKMTIEGQDNTIELCHSFNECYDFIEESMDPLAEEVRLFKNKYKDEYEDEVDTRNELSLELDMYVDFALEPKGSLDNYTSMESDYINTINRLVKVMDSYR